MEGNHRASSGERVLSRTSSHHLSSAAPSTAGNRKGRSLEPSGTISHADKASLSMPPPAARRPSRDSEIGAPKVTQAAPRQSAQDGTGDDVTGDVDTGSTLKRTTTDSEARSGRSRGASQSEQDRQSMPPSPYSLGSAKLNRAWNPGHSNPSSAAGSASAPTSDHGEDRAIGLGATTATSPILVSATSQSGSVGSTPRHSISQIERPNLQDSLLAPVNNHSIAPPPSQAATARTPAASKPPRGRLSLNRKTSGHTGVASPTSDRSATASTDSKDADNRRSQMGIIGICALDSKARSKPCRNILNRINAKQEFEILIFGDKIILDEEPENWPICDYLISFFSDGFPLDKAIKYVKIRRPFSVNDLPMQMVLWDRRICLQILDKFEVRTPRRVEVNRDGGPRLPTSEMALHVYERTGVKVQGPEGGGPGELPLPESVYMVDEDTLCVDGKELRKPFVEKPVSGEDHNIHIYYAKEAGGGGRRLFRKINNKSSEADEKLSVPRSITDQESSYIYESFLNAQNSEDVKAYTVGQEFCHAETRKSPVVDGIVKRNTHGKEIRYMTSLSPEEAKMAARITEAFGQRVCGFDLLRVGDKSYVIDVNGWSFVKDNNEYYDKCAEILKKLFVEEKQRREGKLPNTESESSQNLDSLSHRSSVGHFSSALKSILKSPSMSRLAGYHHQPYLHNNHSGRTHGHGSPEISSQTTFLSSSPPSIEKLPGLSLPGSRMSSRPPTTKPESTIPAAPTPSLTEPGPTDVEHVDEEGKKVPLPASGAQWKLKGMVAVVRHADRTPKQKLKFNFHSKPFVDLLKGHHEEVLLIGESALNSVAEAAKKALNEGLEDPEKLRLLRNAISKKGAWAGTKVQIKPMFRDHKEKKDKNKDKEKEKQKEKKSEKADQKELEKTPNQYPNLEMTTQVEQLKKTETNLSEQDLNDIDGGVPQRKGSLAGMTLSRAAAADDNLKPEKLQLVLKWGGEPTHSARYQSQELAENMKNDLMLMNPTALEDLSVYSSSERRVTTSAAIWTAAFLERKEVPADYVRIRKDLLDDSNAAKDEMDKVKRKLKGLLREGHKAPPQFAWPENMPEPYVVARNVVELMKFHRKVMKHNFSKLNGGAASSLAAAVKTPGKTQGQPSPNNSATTAQIIDKIQGRWCSGEDAELFKERWNKLFDEFVDPEKVDPSKISELHDTMKYDALHNRPFLEWIFAPSPEMLEEFGYPDHTAPAKAAAVDAEDKVKEEKGKSTVPPGSNSDVPPVHRFSISGKRQSDKAYNTHQFPFRKRSSVVDPATLKTTASDPATQSYFSLFTGDAKSRANTDVQLEKLRELFMYSKILFDFIGPQEYGITNAEKLEIGLLTSLPLLKAIVTDLETMQAGEDAKTAVYFTKESHIYTLLNCIIEGGIKTKIDRNKIPELDYLSTICFELYEAPNPEAEHSEDVDPFNYSIRITISPGCHTFEPLDVQLDSKHCIGFAQRRSLTAHNDWRTVIETLRAKFHTVKLPKSFVAVNLSEKVPQGYEDASIDAAEEVLSSIQQADTKESVSAGEEVGMEEGPLGSGGEEG